MAHSTDIVGYVFYADLFTPLGVVEAVKEMYPELPHYPAQLIVDVEDWLTAMSNSLGIDRFDESSYDSDVFPKVVFRDQIEEDTTFCDAVGDYVGLD